METINRIRNAALACMAGALLWVVALLMEYRYDLFSPSNEPLYVVNQSMFALAMIGHMLGILGLFWAQVVRSGFGKITLGVEDDLSTFAMYAALKPYVNGIPDISQR